MRLVENKKIGLKYEVLERLEAGAELLGTEVKSLREKRGSLEGSHVIIRGGEAYLVGAYIPPYQPNNLSTKGYDERRTRRLLLTKQEILELGGREGKGLTIVPVALYNKGRRIKLEIAVVRGKKKYDKRETLKRREDKREIERTLKAKYR